MKLLRAFGLIVCVGALLLAVVEWGPSARAAAPGAAVAGARSRGIIQTLDLNSIARRHLQGFAMASERDFAPWGTRRNYWRAADDTTVEVSAAVCSSATDAAERAHQFLASVSIVFQPVAGTLGDQAWFGNEGGRPGTVLFVRENALVSVFSSDFEIAKVVAAGIDRDIAAAAKYAPVELDGVLLQQSDVAPYELVAQLPLSWPCPEVPPTVPTKDGVDQYFTASDRPRLYVTIFRFMDDESAERGATRYSTSMQAVFREGGLGGQAVGEKCWATESDSEAALLFQRGPFCAIVTGIGPPPSSVAYRNRMVVAIAQKQDEKILTYVHTQAVLPALLDAADAAPYTVATQRESEWPYAESEGKVLHAPAIYQSLRAEGEPEVLVLVSRFDSEDAATAAVAYSSSPWEGLIQQMHDRFGPLPIRDWIVSGADIKPLADFAAPDHGNFSHASSAAWGTSYWYQNLELWFDIYPNAQSAQIGLATRLLMAEIATMPSSEVGDRAFARANPSGSGVTLQRNNVLISVQSHGGLPDVLAIARRMDEELQTGTTFVTRRKIASAPIGQGAPYVKLNGTRIVLPPEATVEDGNSLVLLRPFCDYVGATLTWDEAGQSATATLGGRSVTFTAGEKVASETGPPQPSAVATEQEVTLPVAPCIIEGKIMVPLKPLVRAWGGTVEWVPDMQMVYVNTLAEPPAS